MQLKREKYQSEPTYDETDDYVDVHNKIRINFPPSMIFSPGRSPGAVTPGATNKLKWQSPMHMSPELSNFQALRHLIRFLGNLMRSWLNTGYLALAEAEDILWTN
ncbi:hypothetical protein HAX54_008467 [Datura stramonium]|uniref:Uncharacterized protein n=1 Tax=Datura stramonium TaxID=4076 RepID=A0ABS8TEU4_DATST|nr:hypothetical protein [Datura stramonium]